ncbi:hypothetical protein LAZ67_8002825 [Cordylochernes scorpioides]|uniref:MARVEL domain-containing protein n=1 Tax=Cordylochernes scorpioides TaxID=51811 RepID=A0ABY6KUY2_9ARAC|nr:hypothetical protein LAZ67_8002825 [Cordylochernes scorpioides]
MLIGAVCLGIVGYYGTHHRGGGFSGNEQQTLFFLVSFGCLLSTALMFLTSLCSLITSSVLSKTLFEFLYHLVSFILYLSAALSFLIDLTERNKGRYREDGYDAKMAAAVRSHIYS